MNYTKFIELGIEYFHEIKQKIAHQTLPDVAVKDALVVRKELTEFARAGDVREVARLMSSRDFQVCTKEQRSDMVARSLTTACQNAQLPVVEYFAQLPQYRRVLKDSTKHALLEACFNHHVDVMKMLEEKFPQEAYSASSIDNIHSEFGYLSKKANIKTLDYLLSHPVFNQAGQLFHHDHVVVASEQGHVELLGYLAHTSWFKGLDTGTKEDLMNRSLVAACGKSQFNTIAYLCFSKELEVHANFDNYREMVLNALSRHNPALNDYWANPENLSSIKAELSQRGNEDTIKEYLMHSGKLQAVHLALMEHGNLKSLQNELAQHGNLDMDAVKAYVMQPNKMQAVYEAMSEQASEASKASVRERIATLREMSVSPGEHRVEPKTI